MADRKMPAKPWYDTAGNLFDPQVHARKKDGSPSVNKDGTWRKKRRKRQAVPKSDPIKDNQLLDAFKNHVDQATGVARLNELSTMAGLMSFNADEQALAQGWIREKRKQFEDGGNVG